MDFVDASIIVGLGILCGALGQLTSGYTRGGWIVYVFTGVAGAALGACLASYFDAPEIFNLKFRQTNFPLLWSLIGSVFFVAFINFLVKPGRH